MAVLSSWLGKDHGSMGGEWKGAQSVALCGPHANTHLPYRHDCSNTVTNNTIAIPQLGHSNRSRKKTKKTKKQSNSVPAESLGPCVCSGDIADSAGRLI